MFLRLDARLMNVPSISLMRNLMGKFPLFIRKSIFPRESFGIVNRLHLKEPVYVLMAFYYTEKKILLKISIFFTSEVTNSYYNKFYYYYINIYDT